MNILNICILFFTNLNLNFRWICFKCKNQCNCKSCKEEKNKVETQNDPLNHFKSVIEGKN